MLYRQLKLVCRTLNIPAPISLSKRHKQITGLIIINLNPAISLQKPISINKTNTNNRRRILHRNLTSISLYKQIRNLLTAILSLLHNNTSSTILRTLRHIPLNSIKIITLSITQTIINPQRLLLRHNIPIIWRSHNLTNPNTIIPLSLLRASKIPNQRLSSLIRLIRINKLTIRIIATREISHNRNLNSNLFRIHRRIRLNRILNRNPIIIIRRNRRNNISLIINLRNPTQRKLPRSLIILKRPNRRTTSHTNRIKTIKLRNNTLNIILTNIQHPIQLISTNINIKNNNPISLILPRLNIIMSSLRSIQTSRSRTIPIGRQINLFPNLNLIIISIHIRTSEHNLIIIPRQIIYIRANSISLTT